MDLADLIKSDVDHFDIECTVREIERNKIFASYKMSVSDFVSGIKFDGIPILPPVMTEARREEMRSYKRSAILLETKRRTAARHRMLAQLQSTVRHIDEMHCNTSNQNEKDSRTCQPAMAGSELMSWRCSDLQPPQSCSYDEGISVGENSTRLSNYSNNRTGIVSMTGDIISDSPFTSTMVQHPFDICSRPAVIQFPLFSECSSIVPADGRTTRDYPSKSVLSKSNASPDSGICSKRAAESLVSDSLNCISDAFEISDSTFAAGNLYFSSADLSIPVVEDQYTDNYSDRTAENLVERDLRSSVTALLDEVRSSVTTSTGSDDDMSRTVIGADERLNDSSLTLTIDSNHDQPAASIDSQTAARHVHEAGYGDEIIGLADVSADSVRGCDSDSGNDDDDVLKTVIATRIKSVYDNDSTTYDSEENSHKSSSDITEFKTAGSSRDVTQRCEESSGGRHSDVESVDTADHVPSPPSSGSHQLNLIVDPSEDDSVIASGERLLEVKATEIEDSRYRAVEQSRPAIPDDETRAIDALQNGVENFLDLVQDLNSENTDRSASSIPGYTENRSGMDAAEDVADGATVGMWEAVERVHLVRHKPIVSGDVSSCSDSPESNTPSVEKVTRDPGYSFPRRNSYTLSNPSPALIESNLADVSPPQRAQSSGCEETTVCTLPADTEAIYSLTDSMEDLRLKPLQQKQAGSNPSTSPVILEPPDQYRDSPMVYGPPQDAQGKMDHLQRYLNSLSTDPMDCSPSRNTATGRMLSFESVCHDGHNTNIRSSQSILQSADENSAISDDKLLEQQLQQYETMKRKLLEEHQRSLEHLLAEQERQMTMLQSRLVDHTSGESSRGQQSRSDSRSSALLDASKISTGLKFLKSGHSNRAGSHNPHRSRVGTDRGLATPFSTQDGLAHDEAYSYGGERSPAGVYFDAMASLEDIRSMSEDAETEFAFKSPAVLCSRRRLVNDRSFSFAIDIQTPSTASRMVPPELQQNFSTPGSHHAISPPGAVPHGTGHHADRRPPRRFVDMFSENIPEDVQRKCEKLTAAVKGYLARRLFRTEKVKSIIKTIWDTVEFALQFQTESPMKNEQFTSRDRYLQERVLAQLNSALFEFHEIFFDISVTERMHYIAQDRAIERERRYKKKEVDKSKRISAATLKALERKKKVSQNPDDPSTAKTHRKSTPPGGSERICSSGGERYPRRSSAVAKTCRSAPRVGSPRKPQKDNMHRLIVRDKSRGAGNATRAGISSPAKPRIISRPNKLLKRPSAAAAVGASNSATDLIASRKIARPNGISVAPSRIGVAQCGSSSTTLCGGPELERVTLTSRPSPPNLAAENNNNNHVMVRHVRETREVTKHTKDVKDAASASHIPLSSGNHISPNNNNNNAAVSRNSQLKLPEQHRKQATSSKSG